MDGNTLLSIKLEQAEFVNRLMIDAELTKKDLKIGLCLLHELLLIMKKDKQEVKTELPYQG